MRGARGPSRLGRAAFAVVLAIPCGAAAQRPTTPARAPAVGATAAPTNLRGQVGADRVARLIRSADASERLRGIERAGSLGTPEAIALLVDALEWSPHMKADPRARLTAARALAPFASSERARSGLLAIVRSGSPDAAGLPPVHPSGPSSNTNSDELAELARRVAAIALARSGDERALESLYGTARVGGNGQSAALSALAIHPPRDPGFLGTANATMPPEIARLLGELGDLRALGALHAAARAADVNVRYAALTALGELGDRRAVPLAREALAAADARLRVAGAKALVQLGAREREAAVAALLSDDMTAEAGVRLAERVSTPEITKRLVTRAVDRGADAPRTDTPADHDLRAGALRALGRSADPAAAQALAAPAVLSDPTTAYYALSALARSPAPNAMALITALFDGPSARLAARAYVVRALVRRQRSGAADVALERFTHSRVPSERALGVLARVALGDADASAFLGDADPRVRRAAAMGALARMPNDALEQRLLDQVEREHDAITRQVFAVGLLGGDPNGKVGTSSLMERSESGGGDAPLAAYALARRAEARTAEAVGRLLASSDAVLRAHAARGLGSAQLSDASGRLSDAYSFETDPVVRRAIIDALARRVVDANAPARRRTLETASALDPDPVVRSCARRALTAGAAALGPSPTEVAWVRLTRADGEPPGAAFVGSLVRADGLAVPIVFDEEGYALVPGLPPGEARVVLAPRIPTYEPQDAP